MVPKEQKIESTIETMPNVEVKDSSTKGSYTLPTKSSKTKKVKEPKVKEKKVKEPKVKEPKVKGEKKPGLFSNLFRHSDRSPRAPVLDLPAVERDLSPNNELRAAHRLDSDPLRVPNVDLPTPDIELPTYDKPEVNMATGQTKSSSSEFAIPSVNLPPIPDLHLPGNDDQTVDSTTNLMQIPSIQLPELEFTSNETVSATEIKQESQPEQLTASPVQETFDIQADQIISSNENDSVSYQ